MKTVYLYNPNKVTGDNIIKAITINNKISLYSKFTSDTKITIDGLGNRVLYNFCGSGYQFVKYLKGSGLKPLVNDDNNINYIYINLSELLDDNFKTN